MKVVKEKTEFGTNIIFDEENKFLKINYGGNLDLYWSIYHKDLNKEKSSNEFIITKENYKLYELFEKLYDDIENINLYDDDSLFNIEKEEQKKYRLYNKSNYNKLFDKDKKTITWYSDETSHKVANYLKIKKEDEMYRIDFFTQPQINGYDRDFYSDYYISI